MSTPDQIMHVDHSRSFKTLDDILNYLSPQPLDPEDEHIEAVYDEDYLSNAPCDFSGYCAGTSCPYFQKCKGD